MTTGAADDMLQAVGETARATPGLEVLLLFGSRARGDTWARSDWDFAYLARQGFDPDALVARLVPLLHSDRIDLVDLARAGGQLRYRAARDGRLLYAAEADRYAQFWLSAVSFWCDAAGVVREGYDRVLSELTP